MSVPHSRFPTVHKAFWALITHPGDFLIAVRLDHTVAKVSVLVMIPLALPKWGEEADVRAPLLIS